MKKKLLYKNQEGCKHLQGIILPKRQACQGHKQTIFLIALLITDTVEPLDALHFPPHRGLVFLRCNINNSHGNVAKPALKIFPLYFFPIHDFLITYSENTREARFFLTSQAFFLYIALKNEEPIARRHLWERLCVQEKQKARLWR